MENLILRSHPPLAFPGEWAGFPTPQTCQTHVSNLQVGSG